MVKIKGKITNSLNQGKEKFNNLKNSVTGKIENFKIDRNALIFIGFLGLSMLFWFLKALGKQYETELSCPIRYSDYPEGYVIDNQLPEKLTIQIADEGFDLLRYKLTTSLIPIGFDIEKIIQRGKMNKEKGHAYITSNQIVDEINKQLSSTTRLIDIKPDSIHLYYSKLLSKKVPILSNLDIQPEKQFMVSGKIQIKPDSVMVYGSRNIIDTLRYVLTEREKFHNINDTLVRNISLQNYDEIELDKKRIVVTIPIEPFTEKWITVPVTGRSFPDSLRLRTFPGMVDVSFFVGLSKYNQIQPEDLQAFVDYNKIKGSSKGTAKVELQYNSQFIANPRLKTSELEYLVEFIQTGL